MTTTTPIKPARDERVALTPAQVAEIVRRAPWAATQHLADPIAAARHLGGRLPRTS